MSCTKLIDIDSFFEEYDEEIRKRNEKYESSVKKDCGFDINTNEPISSIFIYDDDRIFSQINKRNKTVHDHVNANGKHRFQMDYETETILKFNCFCSIDKVIVGLTHVVLLDSNGYVYSFGEGFNGQLGHGRMSSTFVRTPTRIEYFVKNHIKIRDVFAGNNFTLCLEEDTNKLYAFGDMFKTIEKKFDIPFCLSDVMTPFHSHRIQHIDAHADHFLFSFDNHQVWAFGNNTYGQLGVGDTLSRYHSPSKITRYFENIKEKELYSTSIGEIKLLKCGLHHSFMLNHGNILYGCGRSLHGQLGIADSLVCKHIVHPTRIIFDTKFIDFSIFRIAAGFRHSLFLLSNNPSLHHRKLGFNFCNNNPSWAVSTISSKKHLNGIVMGCGNNSNGQLGLPTPVTQEEPIEMISPQVSSVSQQNIVDLECSGHYDTLLLTGHGTVLRISHFSWKKLKDAELNRYFVHQMSSSKSISVLLSRNCRFFPTHKQTLFQHSGYTKMISMGRFLDVSIQTL